MCQCMICDCWWWNFGGVCCAGWHMALCCVSCWICKPQEMAEIDADCCHMCTWTGYGEVFLCCGSVCCVPETIKMYSRGLDGEKVVNQVPNTNNQFGDKPY